MNSNKKKYKIHYTDQEGGEIFTAIALAGLATKAALGKVAISSIPIITHAGSHIYLAAHSHTSMALAHNLMSSSTAAHGITSTGIHSIFAHSTASGITPFHAHAISKGLEHSISSHFGGMMAHPAMIHTNSMLTHRGYSALSNSMFSTNTAQIVTSIPPGGHASYLHSFYEFLYKSGIITGELIESSFFSLANLNSILYGIFLAKIFPLFYALILPILEGELDITTLFGQNPTIMLTPDIVTFQSISSSITDLFFLNEAFKSTSSKKLVKDLMPDKSHFMTSLSKLQDSLHDITPEDMFMNYNDEGNKYKDDQNESWKQIKQIKMFDVFDHNKLFLENGLPNLLNWHKTDIVKLVFDYFDEKFFTFHKKRTFGFLGVQTVKDDIKVNIGFYYKIIDGLKDVFLFKKIADECYNQQTFMGATQDLVHLHGKDHPYSKSCGTNTMTYWNCSIHEVALNLLHHDVISGCFTSIFASIFTLGFSDILICAFKKFPDMTWITSLADVEVKDVEGIAGKTINCSNTEFDINLCPAYIINYAKVYIASFIATYCGEATDIITDKLNEGDREKVEEEQEISNKLADIEYEKLNEKSAENALKSIKRKWFGIGI